MTTIMPDFHFSSFHFRLNLNTGGGAWCPVSARPESDGGYEFLEINFINLTVFTALSIQGRWDFGHGREFVRKFRLEYQRHTSVWKKYRDQNKNEVWAPCFASE